MAPEANNSNSPPADFCNPNVPETVAKSFKVRATVPLTAKSIVPVIPLSAEAPVTAPQATASAVTPPVEALEPLAALYWRAALVTDIA